MTAPAIDHSMPAAEPAGQSALPAVAASRRWACHAAGDVSVRRGLLAARPRTPAQLHAWVRRVLGLDVPRVALTPNHTAPFEYLCHAFFEDARPADAPNALVWAARGSGKTRLGAVATLLDMIFKPGIQVCILGGSFAQSSGMHRHLRQMLQDEALLHLVDGRITLSHVTLRNGSRVEVLSQSQTAVRGRRAHRLRCDEVELFEPQVWEAAQMITRSGTCGDTRVRAGVEALSTMHRPFGLMSRLVNQPITNMRLFRWSAIDVLEHCRPPRSCETCALFHEGCGGVARRVECRGFLHIDDALDQRLRISPAAWQAEMLCRRPDVTHCVYPEFDEASHVFDDRRDSPEPASAPAHWLGGLDFGYRSPSVLLLATLDAAGTLRVIDEIFERSCLAGAMIDLARQRCAALGIGAREADHQGGHGGAPLRWIGADPAGLARNEHSGLSTIALWRRAGFIVRARGSTIEAGVELVRARLAAPPGQAAGLRIHRRCGQLIRALREYHYDPDQPTSTRPVKDGPDHAADALRYLVLNLDGHPASQVQRRSY